MYQFMAADSGLLVKYRFRILEASMHEFDEEMIAEIRENFEYFDADSNGTIDFQEFVKLITVLPGDMSEEEMQVGFDIVDTDHNGAIDFDEFLDWWQEQYKP